MRTTIDLPPDIYHIIRAYAKDQKISMGKAISQLITQKQPKPDSGVSEIGFPTFRSNRTLTPEIVKELLEDE
jgi:hypothetical protein